MRVGTAVSVLVDRLEGGFAEGDSTEMKRTRFPSTDHLLVGQCVTVRVKMAKTWVLEGERV